MRTDIPLPRPVNPDPPGRVSIDGERLWGDLTIRWWFRRKYSGALEPREFFARLDKEAEWDTPTGSWKTRSVPSGLPHDLGWQVTNVAWGPKDIYVLLPPHSGGWWLRDEWLRGDPETLPSKCPPWRQGYFVMRMGPSHYHPVLILDEKDYLAAWLDGKDIQHWNEDGLYELPYCWGVEPAKMWALVRNGQCVCTRVREGEELRHCGTPYAEGKTIRFSR